jgi:uncharacterized membrane protein YfcA
MSLTISQVKSVNQKVLLFICLAYPPLPPSFTHTHTHTHKTYTNMILRGTHIRHGTQLWMISVLLLCFLSYIEHSSSSSVSLHDAAHASSTASRSKTWAQSLNSMTAWDGKIGTPCSIANQADDCGIELVCRDNKCAYCESSAECEETFKCLPETDQHSACQTPSLMNHWRSYDTIGTVCIFVGAMLAAGGGLGGGGIFVPLFILVVRLSPYDAVPLSQATILGGSVVNIIMYARQPHPTIPGRPMIDFSAVLLLQPLMLAGTIVGVMLNVVFPSWLIVATLAITLAIASVRTLKKGMRVWKAESHARTVQTVYDHTDSSVSEVSEHDPLINNALPEKEAKQLAEILRSENDPKSSVLWIGVVWVIVCIITFLRGGKGGSQSVAGIRVCTPMYWLVTIAAVPLLLSITMVFGRRLAANHEKKLAFGYKYKEGEIEWSSKNVYLYPLWSTVAGILGGLLGIGGGMVMGPLLVELGMLGQTTSATTSVTVFLTSSSAALQFILLDMMLLDYAAWYLCVGVLATLVGQTVVDMIVKKYKRASIIILTIAIVIIIATVLMMTAGIIKINHDIQQGRPVGFKSFCPQTQA